MADAFHTDPEEIVDDPIPSDEPLLKPSSGTPSGSFVDGMLGELLDDNLAIQQSGPIQSGHIQSGPIQSGHIQSGPIQTGHIQSGPISGSRGNEDEETTGIAFSGGGIRSAAFCSGALRKMLQDKVPLENLSCVSGGGYTGAAFLDWKRRPKDPKHDTDEKWHAAFFEGMRKNAGYMCNWESPCQGFLDSFVLVFLGVLVVFILPCILWLPYAFPVAVVIDVVFGGILRENSTCLSSVRVGTGSSFLILELYDNCDPPARRLALFLTTSIAWVVFFALSRFKPLIRKCRYQNPFRLISIISGLLFAFTFLPWVTHDFLWPLRTWIKVLGFGACLLLPFLFPIVRNVAAIFIFFYLYTLIVSWKVFKTELFGAVPYSDDVFYPILMGCAIAIALFPLIGAFHQNAFNIYYRYRLSKAFFKKAARCNAADCFPAWVRNFDVVTNVFTGKGLYYGKYVVDEDEDEGIENRELTLHDLRKISPTFISNITVNDWQIDGEAKACHQLIAFSSKDVKLVGCNVEEPPEFKDRFKPEHLRLSQAMATSGAAVSYDMGSYETGLDMVLDLLNLLGLGMGDQLASDPGETGEEYKTTAGKMRQYVLPVLVEFFCLLPLIVLPFVYWIGRNKDWVESLVLVHIVIVVVLTTIAFVSTGSEEKEEEEETDEELHSLHDNCKKRKMAMWQRFVRWWVNYHFFVRFIRGFLSINHIGTDIPPVLRLSDGGHFENLALLPLLQKKLKKIVIFDVSNNPGGDKYADSLLTALKMAREKLHCSFEGENGRDINEDIRVKFLGAQHDHKHKHTQTQEQEQAQQDQAQPQSDQAQAQEDQAQPQIDQAQPQQDQARPQKDQTKQRPRSYRFKVHYYDDNDIKQREGEILFVAPRHPSEGRPVQREITEQPKTWADFKLGELDDKKWGPGPELNEREADSLTYCCCQCCHFHGSPQCCSCRWISEKSLGQFPHHITANQFFTSDIFTAYHREGYAACVEADVAGFFKDEPTQDDATQTA